MNAYGQARWTPPVEDGAEIVFALGGDEDWEEAQDWDEQSFDEQAVRDLAKRAVNARQIRMT